MLNSARAPPLFGNFQITTIKLNLKEINIMGLIKDALSLQNELSEVLNGKELKKIVDLENLAVVKVNKLYPHTSIDEKTGEAKNNYIALSDDFYFYTPTSLTRAIDDALDSMESETALEELNSSLEKEPECFRFERIKLKDGHTFIKTFGV